MKKFIVLMLLGSSFSIMCSERYQMPLNVRQMTKVITNAIDSDQEQFRDWLNERNSAANVAFLAKSLVNKICSEQDLYQQISFAYFRDDREIYCPVLKLLTTAIVVEVKKNA